MRKDKPKHDHNLRMALEDFSKAVELNPLFFDARLNKARVLMELGEADQAIVELNVAAKILPVEEEIYLLRGRCYMRLNYLDNAEKDFTKAVGLNPLNQDGYYFLGSIQLAKHDYEQALVSFNRALKLFPKFTFALFQRARVFEALGRQAEDTKDFERLFELDPDFSNKLQS